MQIIRKWLSLGTICVSCCAGDDALDDLKHSSHYPIVKKCSNINQGA